ncbi:recombinase family protein [Nocardioides panacisoli]|uniref:Recombinase family protein n=1 Tax=Nocardioides panacisoli TaxID=627624 RepID=A0ABP7IGB3_9ACTN
MGTKQRYGDGARAVIYCRVSRDDSGAEGASSTERQLEDCRALARLKRWNVVAEEIDQGISAYGVKERPAWERVLAMVDAGQVDVIVAWHLDRMTRNMLDLERLILLAEGNDVGVATVTGDIDLTGDTGRMVARILAAVARAEVERKGARQRRANESRAAEGLPWRSGWAALGYTLGGEVIEEQADHLRKAAEDVLNGVSLREIARRWNAEGVTTPRNSQGVNGWTHKGVRSVLLNPRYAGFATYKGEIVGKGQWEPILSEETHALLVAKLTSADRNTRGSAGRAPANLLSGIALCGVCREPVTGGTRALKSERVGVYRCPNEHLNTYRADADDAVREAFAVAALTAVPGAVLTAPESVSSSELWEERQRLSDRLTGLSTAYADGALSLEQLKAATERINERLAGVEQQLSELDAAGNLDARAVNAENVQRFRELNTDGQRAILARLAVVTLYPKGRGRKGVPITEQVTVYVRADRGNGEELIPALDELSGVHLPSDRLARPSDLVSASVAESLTGKATL